jgi:large subunit ribosomal protein L2
MSLKKYVPVTPSSRELVLVDKSSLWKGRPEKKLTFGLSKTGGRNNYGRITTRHIGGGHKKLYRIIDFSRKKVDIEAVVERIEYDPNRTAFIALIVYADGERSYIICPDGLKEGDSIVSGKQSDIKVGNALPFLYIPVGTIVHNIEIKPGTGGKLARSAGSYAQLVSKDGGYAQIRMNSGEIRLVSVDSYATIGYVSNLDHKNVNYGKAGRKRWLGVRPTVRGVAMNTIDHPHGGGEGRTSGGRHPVTPWGKPTKGKKTRKNKFTSVFIVKSRHRK